MIQNDYKEELKKLVKNEFNKLNLKSIQNISNALTTKAYKLTFTNGFKLIAKVAFDPSDITDHKGDKEVKILKMLNEKIPHIPTPKVYAYYKTYPNFPGYIVFLEVLPGKVINPNKFNEIATKKESLNKLANWMHEVHLIKYSEVTDFASFNADSTAQYIDKYLIKFQKQALAIPQVQDIIPKINQSLSLLKEFYKGHKEFHLLHRDINFKNILVNKGQISAIIDWEGAFTCPLSFEFAHVSVLAPIYGVSTWYNQLINTYAYKYEIDPQRFIQEINMAKIFPFCRYMFRDFSHTAQDKQPKVKESGESYTDYYLRAISEWKFPF